MLTSWNEIEFSKIMMQSKPHDQINLKREAKWHRSMCDANCFLFCEVSTWCYQRDLWNNSQDSFSQESSVDSIEYCSTGTVLDSSTTEGFTTQDYMGMYNLTVLPFQKGGWNGSEIGLYQTGSTVIISSHWSMKLGETFLCIEVSAANVFTMGIFSRRSVVEFYFK